jgi:hypothetical protein
MRGRAGGRRLWRLLLLRPPERLRRSLARRHTGQASCIRGQDGQPWWSTDHLKSRLTLSAAAGPAASMQWLTTLATLLADVGITRLLDQVAFRVYGTRPLLPRSEIVGLSHLSFPQGGDANALKNGQQLLQLLLTETCNTY